jgi:guanylate kinase
MNNENLPKMNQGKGYYRTKPLVIVLSGPSGVGKDAAIAQMRKSGMDFHYVVTATTRPRRQDEQDGINYHFVSEQAFKKMISGNQLLEWARVYDHFYGIPKKELDEAIKNGQDAILKIDIQGAATIRQLITDAIFIFLVPSSVDELAARLKLRANQSENDLKVRILKAEEEIKSQCLFDYVVINHQDKLDLTVSRINAIITAEKHRVEPK